MSFFKSLLTSCLGTILGLGTIFFSIFALVLVIRGCSSGPQVPANTVLLLNLKGPLPELSNNQDGGPINLEAGSLFDEQLGLNDVLKLIEIASQDEQIKGIMLNMDETSTLGIGLATMQKLRQSLEAFRKEGKFILAYANGYSQRGYFLASVADQVYLHPQGGLEFVGFGAKLTFFKGLLDKLGVKAQVFYAGKFKSATEPYRRKDMSEENKLQVREYLEDLYNYYLEQIARSRKLEVKTLRDLAENLSIRKPQQALDAKLVDGLKYRDEVLDELHERLGLAKDKKISSFSLADYAEAKAKDLKAKAKEQVVAVVVAEGEIVDGQGKKGNIGGERYARIIRELRKDKSIKAIVLRINSGGGSALASDIIWRELELAKAQGIRVVSSMGDVAASGGYYIACGTEQIFAEPITITGSIGVFGLIPNWRNLFEEKLGLTMDSVRTTRHATMDGMYFDFDERERNFIQESVDDIYLLFKTRVAQARKMDLDKVDEVAQGRVWTGRKAQTLGLVDSLGGTKEAVASAAKLANLSDYAVVYYPKITKPTLFSLFENEEEQGSKKLSLDAIKAWEQAKLKQGLGPLVGFWEQVAALQSWQGVQARMPFELIWD